MRRTLVLAIVGVFAALPNAASAQAGFDFSFTAAGTSGVGIGPGGIGLFPLDMVGASGLTNDATGLPEPSPFSIASVELEISGLTHPSPMDLTVLLLDPFGRNVVVMDGQGGAFAVSGVDLTFNDAAAAALPIGAPISTGTFLPSLNSFSQFDNSGTDAWLLVVINDVRNNQLAGGDPAGFDSFTLRGVVPEPMTLSLLALGAMATLRRSRR